MGTPALALEQLEAEFGARASRSSAVRDLHGASEACRAPKATKSSASPRSVTLTTGIFAAFDAAKGFPGIKVLASQPANYQRLQALQVMENLMQSYPQIDGVFAANDAMAAGAIEALDGANRKAKIVGINGTKEAIDAIKAGKMLATGDYNGFLQGCVGTMTAIRHLRKLPVKKDVVFPAMVVDKTNYQALDVPVESRSCPKWEDVVKM